MNSRYKQRGLSLIELMVALLLSSFLILGVTQIYIDNKRNYLFQQGQGENQENGRFALMFLEKELARAGYRRDPRSDLGGAFPANNQLDCGFEEGQAVARVDASTICTRYQPRDKGETDCQGNRPFSSHTNLDDPYADTFKAEETVIQKITFSDGGLRCQTASSSSSAELIEGMQAIYFDYGVNGSLDDRVVDKYTSSPATGEYVRSLRYFLLLAAAPSNLTDGVTNRLCENTDNPESIGDWQKLTGHEFDCEEGKLYQMVGGSATLRNLMP